MEDLKRQILEEVDKSKMQIIKWLIIAIVFICFMFSFTICFMNWQSYNYDYEVPSFENTNNNGGN